MKLTKKEYLFNFVGGGWNSVFAKTLKGAISEAKKSYKNSKCVIDEKSFRISTEADYRANMSLFD